MKIAIRKLPHAADLPLPAHATPGAAGQDLVAAIESDIVLAPGKWQLIPTGIAIALPAGFEAQVRPRSGLAAKHGIGMVNAPGTVDCDYRGELKVNLINYGSEPFTISRGMRIAQMIIARYERVEWEESDSLPDSERGTGGFGSTGR